MESDPIEETPPKRLKTGGGFVGGRPYKSDDESADELFDGRALQFTETIAASSTALCSPKRLLLTPTACHPTNTDLEHSSQT
jgi:hypothetical protein